MEEDFSPENTHKKSLVFQMYCFTSSIPALSCVPVQASPCHCLCGVDLEGSTSWGNNAKEAHAEREREREREDYVIPVPYWTTPTFIKHSRDPQSDSTPDVFEGSEKDHLCLIKVNIKTIFILIIHQQKCVARGPCHSEKCQRPCNVWCQWSRSGSSSVWPHVLR